MLSDNDKKLLLNLDDAMFDALVSNISSLLSKADQLLASHVEFDYNTMHLAPKCNPDEMEEVEKGWSNEVLNFFGNALCGQTIAIVIDLLYADSSAPGAYSEYGKKRNVLVEKRNLLKSFHNDLITLKSTK